MPFRRSQRVWAGHLVGYALFDCLSSPPDERDGLQQHCWRKREIENYFCRRELLLRWTEEMSSTQLGPIFVEPAIKVMEESISELESALNTLGQPSPWSDEVKASDDFLDPLFEKFFAKVGIEDLMRKTSYHQLARLLRRDEIDHEVVEVLDAIVRVSSGAHGSDLPD